MRHLAPVPFHVLALVFVFARELVLVFGIIRIPVVVPVPSRCLSLPDPWPASYAGAPVYVKPRRVKERQRISL